MAGTGETDFEVSRFEVVFSSQPGWPRSGHQGSDRADRFAPGRFSLGGDHKTGEHCTAGHRYFFNSRRNWRLLNCHGPLGLVNPGRQDKQGALVSWSKMKTKNASDRGHRS